MSKKKHKFDLTSLVHKGIVKENETLSYVTDPRQTCVILKMPNGEYKVKTKLEVMTVHGFVQKCLGQEPPDHASRWLRTEGGKILFDAWHEEEFEEAA